MRVRCGDVVQSLNRFFEEDSELEDYKRLGGREMQIFVDNLWLYAVRFATKCSDPDRFGISGFLGSDDQAADR